MDRTKRRNIIGTAAWFAVGLLIGGLAFVPMAAREWWQWKHYGLPKLETDDIERYGLAISAGAIVQCVAIVWLWTAR